MSLGLRLAIAFTCVIVVITSILVATSGLVCLLSLGMVGKAASDPREAIFGALVCLGVFVALLSFLLACLWMVQVLRARPSLSEAIPEHVMRQHPALAIGIPPLQSIAAYASLSVFNWVAIGLAWMSFASWVWPVIWSAIAGVAFYSLKLLRRSFPDDAETARD
jgi:hypothetical protein